MKYGNEHTLTNNTQQSSYLLKDFANTSACLENWTGLLCNKECHWLILLQTLVIEHTMGCYQWRKNPLFHPPVKCTAVQP